MKELQNWTLFSHLVLPHALKKKVLKLILEKMIVPNIRSCLRTQINQNMKYKVASGETIVVRSFSSVFVALSMWKTSPVGEIWVKIHSFFLVQELRLHMNGLSLIDWFTIMEFFVFHSFLMIRRILLSFDLKMIRVEKPDNSVSNLGKNGHFQSGTHGVAVSEYFQTRFFHSTFWLNSAHNVIFRAQMRQVQSRQQHCQIESVLSKQSVSIGAFAWRIA